VVKPQSLWTGKQLFTTVLEHMTHGRAPMTFSHGTKTPANYWGGDGSGEGELIVRRNYVCSGILDKNVFGKFGLVHAVVELHGPVLAGDLISALSRLLTAFLQAYGMTCGMDDLLLQPASEVGRRAALDEAQRACRGAAATFAEADASVPDVALRRQIATRLREREGAEATLDMRSSSALNKVGPDLRQPPTPQTADPPNPRPPYLSNHTTATPVSVPPTLDPCLGPRVTQTLGDTSRPRRCALDATPRSLIPYTLS
jgi:DNA-directed RNA polymerase I subunit RPA1